MKDIALPALLLAAAVLLDFLTLRHRPAIFELFYRWWFRLSEANLTMVGERGVRGFSNLVDRVFGPKILSMRSVLRGALFVFGSTLAVSSLSNFGAGPVGYQVTTILITTILISAGALIPGIVNFEGARVLIHILSKRVTFTRIVLFGLASFVLAEITVIFGYASLGLFMASLVKLGYSHQLALADAVPVSGILLLLALGLMSTYLAVAVLPAICCILAWTWFVILYLSSKFALLVRYFLADRIEQEPVAGGEAGQLAGRHLAQPAGLLGRHPVLAEPVGDPPCALQRLLRRTSGIVMPLGRSSGCGAASPTDRAP